MKYSTFSIYNFKLIYPTEWKVKLIGEASFLKGNIVFFDLEGKESIYIAWDDLKKAKEKYASAKEQACSSLSKMVTEKKYSQGKIKVIEQKAVYINTHEGYLNHFELSTLKFGLIPLFPKSILHTIKAIFIHCDESQRFFLIIGDSHPDKFKDLEEKLYQIIKSFNCHLSFEVI